MAENIERIAELMGAKIIGQVPEVGGGAFGAARLGHIHRQRMTAVRSEELLQGLGLSDEIRRSLAEMAEQASKPGRIVTPAQIAAQLLEEAVRKHREAS